MLEGCSHRQKADAHRDHDEDAHDVGYPRVGRVGLAHDVDKRYGRDVPVEICTGRRKYISAISVCGRRVEKKKE